MGTRLSKIGGILQETSTEELARQQALPSAPTSPIGVAGIGGSQDMAKMAGTGAQIRASLRETLKERKDTRDVLGEAERGAVRKRFNVEKIQTQLQTLEGLGSLDNRVAAQARSIITGGVGAAPAFENTINDTAIREAIKAANIGISETDLTTLVANAKTTIKALRDNASATNIAAVLSSLGIAVTIDQPLGDLVTKLQQTGVINQAGVAEIKKKIDETAATTKDIKIKDLAQVDFDKEAAAQVLGVKTADLEGMTLGEVKAQLAAYRSENFTDIDQLREVLSNPFSSTAQKDFARARLAELGAVGVTSLEQKTDNLQVQMAEGDTVKVGNQQIKVEQLTTDPQFRAIIATALDSPEELDKLRQTDKELADYIDKNKKALTEVKDQLAAGLGNFAKNQKEIKDYFTDAPSDTLDKLIPGWRTAKDTTLAKIKEDLATNNPSVKYALDMTDKNKKSMALGLLATTGKPIETTVLQSIVDVATSSDDATALYKSWTDSEDTAWQAGITTTLAFTPVFDADLLEEDYDKIIAERIKDTGYTSLKEIVDKINKLRVSTNPRERAEAIELSKTLATIKGTLNRELSKDKIDNIKKENKTNRVKAEFTTTYDFVDKSVAGIVNQISGRAENNWLRRRGSEVFANIKSESRRIATDAGLGKITWDDAKAQIEGLKGRMAGELAAFLGDTNTEPGDALDAAELISANGLINSLSAGDRAMILKRIRKDLHINTYDKNRLSSPEKLQRIYNAFGGTEFIYNLAIDQERDRNPRLRRSAGRNYS